MQHFQERDMSYICMVYGKLGACLVFEDMTRVTLKLCCYPMTNKAYEIMGS